MIFRKRKFIRGIDRHIYHTEHRICVTTKAWEQECSGLASLGEWKHTIYVRLSKEDYPYFDYPPSGTYHDANSFDELEVNGEVTFYQEEGTDWVKIGWDFMHGHNKPYMVDEGEELLQIYANNIMAQLLTIHERCKKDKESD